MSQTVVARRIAATPARSAADAWRVIAELTSPSGSEARQELDRAGGVAMSLIADEAMRESPIVVAGIGPLLRIYCVYGTEAILGEGVSEGPLAACPTVGQWLMSLPCSKEDLGWAQKALARVSARVTVRDLEESAPPKRQDQNTKEMSGLGSIDVEAFLRP